MRRGRTASFAVHQDRLPPAGRMLMLRWLGVLIFLSALTGLLAFGGIPTRSAGLARTLFSIFSVMLAASLVLGILRRT